MTPNEIQMLCAGVALGSQSMAVLNMWWDAKDARRNLAVSRAALKRSAGDRYLGSLRLYQLRQRSRV
ncbi:hypothetical protein [Streptomyces sp. NPDC002779]|uniref:hypothetical protein n=1 Tax=Streptomyces sp. NPDC002779 TaxID=3364664 RepID=UPI0036C1192B